MDVAALARAGLARDPKSLPAVLFYDAEGSALFDEITRTPEYYLTRAELSIFEAHGRDILRRANGHGPLSLVELGAGSATKTRVLLRQLLGAQKDATYVPIDVSPAPLHAIAATLPREFPGLDVRPIVADNAAALAQLPQDGPARLLLFIGSSIGNFEPDEAIAFLSVLAQSARPHDHILLGTDLAKERATLEAAYNDAAGVTARFNLNALARLNREYGADFDLGAFEHRAHYDEERGRIEMHLVSLRKQSASIPRLDLRISLQRGETIHTENSYKYTEKGVQALAARAGLRVERTWTDSGHRMAVHLLRRADA